jgi:hypothetical protein
MSNYQSAMPASSEDEQKWLFSQFQAACVAFNEKSSYRRGPFLVDKEDVQQTLSLKVEDSSHKVRRKSK